MLQAADLEHLSASFAASQAAERAAGGAEAAQPLQDGDVQRIDALTDGQELRWTQTGFRLVAEVAPSVVLFLGASMSPAACQEARWISSRGCNSCRQHKILADSGAPVISACSMSRCATAPSLLSSLVSAHAGHHKLPPSRTARSMYSLVVFENFKEKDTEGSSVII